MNTQNLTSICMQDECNAMPSWQPNFLDFEKRFYFNSIPFLMFSYHLSVSHLFQLKSSSRDGCKFDRSRSHPHSHSHCSFAPKGRHVANAFAPQVSKYDVSKKMSATVTEAEVSLTNNQCIILNCVMRWQFTIHSFSGPLSVSNIHLRVHILNGSWWSHTWYLFVYCK